MPALLETQTKPWLPRRILAKIRQAYLIHNARCLTQLIKSFYPCFLAKRAMTIAAQPLRHNMPVSTQPHDNGVATLTAHAHKYPRPWTDQYLTRLQTAAFQFH